MQEPFVAKEIAI